LVEISPESDQYHAHGDSHTDQPYPDAGAPEFLFFLYFRFQIPFTAKGIIKAIL